MHCLPENFYLADPTALARELLGKHLVRRVDGQRVSGVITETEAYRGEEDMACHARSGMTRRNAVMYGLPGRAYIYFTYGMHWCFNAVCGLQGFPAAVLVRALKPDEGLEFIAGRRQGIKQQDWCSGPARLCKALAIAGDLNGVYLCEVDSPLLIEDAPRVDDAFVTATARVGIQYAPEPWRSLPWRFRFNQVRAITDG
jgi:DNA-3-methyladenine glycosylase